MSKVPGEIHDVKKLQPLQVEVNSSFDEALKRFKVLVQKEKVISLYKEKQSYEKPSERKRRKRREAQERKRLLDLRESMMISGEWDKKQAKKYAKKFLKVQDDDEYEDFDE